jgi:hypothetical protein
VGPHRVIHLRTWRCGHPSRPTSVACSPTRRCS